MKDATERRNGGASKKFEGQKKTPLGTGGPTTARADARRRRLRPRRGRGPGPASPRLAGARFSLLAVRAPPPRARPARRRLSRWPRWSSRPAARRRRGESAREGRIKARSAAASRSAATASDAFDVASTADPLGRVDRRWHARAAARAAVERPVHRGGRRARACRPGTSGSSSTRVAAVGVRAARVEDPAVLAHGGRAGAAARADHARAERRRRGAGARHDARRGRGARRASTRAAGRRGQGRAGRAARSGARPSPRRHRVASRRQLWSAGRARAGSAGRDRAVPRRRARPGRGGGSVSSRRPRRRPRRFWRGSPGRSSGRRAVLGGSGSSLCCPCPYCCPCCCWYCTYCT